jgi:hypothetical protein
MSKPDFSRLPAEALLECRAKIDEALKAKAIGDLRAKFKEMASAGWCQHLARVPGENIEKLGAVHCPFDQSISSFRSSGN